LRALPEHLPIVPSLGATDAGDVALGDRIEVRLAATHPYEREMRFALA
jgi:hypothetical protein